MGLSKENGRGVGLHLVIMVTNIGLCEDFTPYFVSRIQGELGTILEMPKEE